MTSGMGRNRRNGNRSTQPLPIGSIVATLSATIWMANTSGSVYCVGVVFPYVIDMITLAAYLREGLSGSQLAMMVDTIPSGMLKVLIWRMQEI